MKKKYYVGICITGKTETDVIGSEDFIGFDSLDLAEQALEAAKLAAEAIAEAEGVTA